MYPTNNNTTDLIKSIKGHILDPDTRRDTTAQLWINQNDVDHKISMLFENQLDETRAAYEKNVDQVLSALVQVLYREWE